MRHVTLCWAAVVLAVGCCTCAPLQDDAIVFQESKSADSENVITPPKLPVIEHLENDPTTFVREDKRIKDGHSKKPGITPKFGFDVVPASGGFSASFSHGFTGFGGSSQSGSHSVSLGAGINGIQLSQSSSQSSNFGTPLLGSSISGSHSSSQSSSFSGGFNGLSSSSSAASSSALSGNAFGQGFSSSGAQSQSAANSLGLFGPSAAFGQSSGHASSFNGQSAASGQSSSGSFGHGAIGQASGVGVAQNNGFTSAGAQSLAAVNSGRQFNGSKQGEIDSGIIKFPGPITNRYPKRYKPIPQIPPRGSIYDQRNRRPSAYEWYRIVI